MKLIIEQHDDTVQVSGDGVTVTYERHTVYPATTVREILSDIRDEVAEHAVAFGASDPVVFAGSDPVVFAGGE